MPDDAIGEPVPDAFRGASFDRPSLSQPSTSRDGMRQHQLQTLRLVAPSTTSLLKPRSQHNSGMTDSDMDWSAAAAFQAKYRRRQRSDTPEFAKSDKEQLTSMCFEQHSQATFQDSTSEPRPFFRRVYESLRSLNCARPSKKFGVTPI